MAIAVQMWRRIMASFRKKCPFCDIPPRTNLFYRCHVPLAALAY